MLLTEQAMRCAPPAWRLSGPQIFVVPSEGSEGSELRMVRAQFQIPHPSQSNFIFPGHIVRDSVVIRLREREDRRVSLEMVVNVNKNLFPILILCYTVMLSYSI